MEEIVKEYARPALEVLTPTPWEPQCAAPAKHVLWWACIFQDVEVQAMAHAPSACLDLMLE